MSQGSVKVATIYWRHTNAPGSTSQSFAAGELIDVGWSNVFGANGDNWFGLYRTTADDRDYINMRHMSGQVHGMTQGAFYAPIEPGTYDIRGFYSKTAAQRIAGSPTFLVGADYLNVAHMNVGPFGQGWASWKRTNPTPGDYIAMFNVNTGVAEGDNSKFGTGGGASGQTLVTIPGGVNTPPNGLYDWRLCDENNVQWARSDNFRIQSNTYNLPAAPAGAVGRVFDSIRNNGSSQRADFWIASPSPGDLIAICYPHDADGVVNYSSAYTGGRQSGWVDIPVNAGVPVGTMHLRYFHGGTGLRVAASAPFAVMA